MGSTGGATGCHRCGNFGHWARDCPGPSTATEGEIAQDPVAQQRTLGHRGDEAHAGSVDVEGEDNANGLKGTKKSRRPKLTYDTLKQPAGIPDVYHNFPSTFRGSVAHGKGQELSKIRKLLELYKRWNDRVYPHAAFDKFIADTEELSKSSVVKLDLHEMRENLIKVAVEHQTQRTEREHGANQRHSNQEDTRMVVGENISEEELLRLALEGTEAITAPGPDAEDMDDELLRLVEDPPEQAEAGDDELLALAFS